MKALMHVGLFAYLLLVGLSVQAVELVLHPVQVAKDVYVIVGDLGNQRYENDGLNSNLGFVVGTDGVLVINSGPTTRVARALHSAIKQVTSQPIKWVVNSNSQSHYWLGNDYFKQLGIPIFAHAEAIRLMHEMGAGQLQSSKSLLKEKSDNTALAYPSESLQDKRTLQLGKSSIQLLYFGSAHTAGDVVVWLPAQKVLFAGDIVVTERMLSVIPIGNSGGWVKAFDQAMALKPHIIVPGHGKPTDAQTATRDTRDYLVNLRGGAQRILAANGSLQDAVEKIDQSKFRYLLNFDMLAKRNMNQVYTEMEHESF